MTVGVISPSRRSGPNTRPRSDGPEISIVVVSTRSRSVLTAFLSALVSPCLTAGVELLVVRAAPATELAEWRRIMPTVRWVAAPADATVAELRAIGMAESTGDVVRIAEDDRDLDVRWVHAVLGDRASAGK